MNAAEIACASVVRAAKVASGVVFASHGGHSLLRAMAVKFDLTMAAYDLDPVADSLNPHNQQEASMDRYPPKLAITNPGQLNHIARRWHEFSAAYSPN